MNKKANILIVDDTYEKTQIVAKAIKEKQFCSISTCISVRSAIEHLKTTLFDIIVIDLHIPLDIGEDVDPNGGRQLVEYINLHEDIIRPTHIIGITSHQEAFDQCLEYFTMNGWPLILDQLGSEKIREIIFNKIHYSARDECNYDVGILTALRKTELDAVLALPCNWEEIRCENDNSIYHVGEVKTNNGSVKRIIATSCSRMGMAAAASTAMKMCLKFSPRLMIMTGIAAGVEGKTQFGDLLVADPCWDWGNGKRTVVDGASKQLSAPHQIEIDAAHRTIFQEISATRKYLDAIYSNWPSDKRPLSSLNLHLGPVASGSVVLEDPEVVATIIQQHRELIGIEMEAYGFYYACKISGKSGIKPIVIKSVCDFANPNKNNDWQKYAAYTSSQLVFHLINDNLIG